MNQQKSNDTRKVLPLEQQTPITEEEHARIIYGKWPINNAGQFVGLRIIGWEEVAPNQLQCNFERVEEDEF